jgi:S1-C subfamily serine protease
VVYLPRSTMWTLEAEEGKDKSIFESIYRIHCLDKLPGGLQAMSVPSTGFLLNNGCVITALHVVRGHTPSEVVAFSIYNEKVEFTEIIGGAAGGPDIAILRPSKPLNGGLTLSDDDKLRVGEQVAALGFPYLGGGTGQERTMPLLSMGFLSGYDDYADDLDPIKYFIVNGGVTIGNSGSPLFKFESREVIGMILRKFAPFTPDVAPELAARDPELVNGMFYAYNVISPGMMYRAICASELMSFLSKNLP